MMYFKAKPNKITEKPEEEEEDDEENERAQSLIDHNSLLD